MLFTRAIIIVGELEADFLVDGCLAATEARLVQVILISGGATHHQMIRMLLAHWTVLKFELLLLYRRRLSGDLKRYTFSL